MKDILLFTGSSGDMEISRQTTPEFWLLYQQSVLLSLKEQGVLNEMQYELCLNELTL